MKNITLAAVIALAASAVTAEPMWFKSVGNGGNCNGCGWTIAEGEITVDTPEDFLAYLDKEEGPETIHFHSSGGSLGPAIDMGRIIRERGLSAAVSRSAQINRPFWEQLADDGKCDSACVFAFLGGRVRLAEEGQLGIHQFFAREHQNIRTAETQRIMGILVMYLIDMGISTELLALANLVEGPEPRGLTASELASLGIVNEPTLSPVRLAIREGGLTASWIGTGFDGLPDKETSLRCSAKENAWLLSIIDRDVGALASTEPLEPVSLAVSIDNRDWPLNQASLVELQRDGSDWVISIRLPMDVRDFAGGTLLFEPYTANALRTILSTSILLPDAATLDVLVRACGD